MYNVHKVSLLSVSGPWEFANSFSKYLIGLLLLSFIKGSHNQDYFVIWKLQKGKVYSDFNADLWMIKSKLLIWCFGLNLKFFSWQAIFFPPNKMPAITNNHTLYVCLTWGSKEYCWTLGQVFCCSFVFLL